VSAIFTKKWWHIIINFNLYTSVVEQEEGNKILYTVDGIHDDCPIKIDVKENVK